MGPELVRRRRRKRTTKPPVNNCELRKRTIAHLKKVQKQARKKEEEYTKTVKTRFKDIKRKSDKSPFHKFLSIYALDAKEGNSHLVMYVDRLSRKRNWSRVAHGGAIFTLADAAAGVAIQTLIDYKIKTIASFTAKIDLETPAKCPNELHARATVRNRALLVMSKEDKKMLIVDVKIDDQNSMPISKSEFHFLVL